MKPIAISLVLAQMIFSLACTVGPRYSRASAPSPVPDAWKTEPPWEPARQSGFGIEAGPGSLQTFQRTTAVMVQMP
jgi:hypothetical protein